MASKIRYIEAACFLKFLSGYLHEYIPSLEYNKQHVFSDYAQLNIRYENSAGTRMSVSSLTWYRPEGTKEIFFLYNKIQSMMNDIIRLRGYDYKYGKKVCIEWIRKVHECLVEPHDNPL